jgi:endonuclease/exonuclease/phosphatase family metal-dependent hydrolase
MKVLSFNILAEQFINYEDLSLDYKGIHPKTLSLKTRLPKIINVLLKSNADIIFLQEVNPLMHALLKYYMHEYRVLPLARNASPEARQKGNAYGNVTLLRKNVFTNVVVRRLVAPMSGNVFGITECRAKKRKFILVNVHLDASEADIVRKAEARYILLYLKNFYKTHVMVLAGDFNTNRLGVHRYFSAFRPAVKKHIGTYLADKPMIDWIYVYGAIPHNGYVARPKKEKVRHGPDTPLKKYGSDHYPVVCDLILLATGGESII